MAGKRVCCCWDVRAAAESIEVDQVEEEGMRAVKGGRQRRGGGGGERRG